MGRNRTLFHYLLGLTSPSDTRSFSRIIAADGIERLPELLKEYEELKKKGKIKESPLDLTPEEFDALTRVRRDQKNIIDVSIRILSKNLKVPLSEGDIKNKVFDLYEKYKNNFDSLEDISYDPKDNILSYHGPKVVYVENEIPGQEKIEVKEVEPLKELLDSLGVLKVEKIQKETEEQDKTKHVAGDYLDLSIPIDQLQDLTKNEVQEGINLYRQLGAGEKKAKIDQESDSLLFKGSKIEFVALLSRLGLSSTDSEINRLAQYVRKD